MFDINKQLVITQKEFVSLINNTTFAKYFIFILILTYN